MNLPKLPKCLIAQDLTKRMFELLFNIYYKYIYKYIYIYTYFYNHQKYQIWAIGQLGILFSSRTEFCCLSLYSVDSF